jgi:hypothetical protein
MTGAELVAAANATEPESIPEYNAFSAFINAINAEHRRVAAVPKPLHLLPILGAGECTALRAMLREPDRSWSIAGNVKFIDGRTLKEYVTTVAPHVDGSIPSRETLFLALGRVVDDSVAMSSTSTPAAEA